MKHKKEGQVWVETVIYTVIGLALIALVLAFLMPKINQARDKSSVEQSIEVLSVLDQKMQEVENGASGSSRIIPSLQLKRGTLTIDASSDKVSLILNDLKYAYSEPGIAINYGGIKVITEQLQNNYKVTLELPSSIDIQYKGREDSHIFTAAAVPYKFSITNIDNLKINIEEISGSG